MAHLKKPETLTDLHVRLLEQLKKFLEFFGHMRLGCQESQNFDIDLHGIRKYREKFVIFEIAQYFVVDMHQRIQFLGLQEFAEKVEFLV